MVNQFLQLYDYTGVEQLHGWLTATNDSGVCTQSIAHYWAA